jgi:peptide/nickel transport system permease protein
MAGTRSRRLLALVRRFVRQPAGAPALGFLLILTALALLAPHVTPHDPLKTSSRVLQEPSARNALGTDYLGRDVLSRMVWGLRLSLLVAVVSAAISALLGLGIGAVAGYSRGRVDALLMRGTDGFMVLPAFFLLVVVVSLFGSGVWILSLMIGLTNWPTVARLVRGEVLSLRTRDFVIAAEALGAPTWAIILRHVVPGTLPVVLVNTSLRAGYAVVTEASLGFLGLGEPSGMSLGGMLTNTVQFARVAWWVAVFPGLLLTLLVLAFSALGDALNDALAPESA